MYTISPGSLFKGEDNKYILLWHRAKWGDIVCDPQWQESRVTQPLKTLSAQIKVNTRNSKCGQIKPKCSPLDTASGIGYGDFAADESAENKNDTKQQSQGILLLICGQKHLEVSKVPPQALISAAADIM